MAGLVPIRLGTATNSHSGPLASIPGDGEPATGFAAVLSGVFNPGTRPKTPSVAVKLFDAGFLNPGNGLESPAPAATKSSDPWPLNPEDESNTPQSAAAKPPGWGQVNAGDGPKMPPLTVMKSSGSRPFHPIPGAATTAPTGGRPDTSSNASTINGMAQSPQGALMPQPGSTASPGDDTGLDLGSLKLDENAQTSPEDARSVTALLSEADLTMPFGNTKDEGRHGETTAPVLPAVTSGKNRDGDSGSPVRGHRLSDETLVPAVCAAASRGVPDAASTCVGLAFQHPTGMVNIPATMLPPLSDTVVTSASDKRVATASDQVVATASQIKVGSGGMAVDPHRPAPADPGKAQPDSADHPAGATSPPAVLLTAVEPEKIVARSDAVPETPALTMRADVPQTSPAGTAPSALSQTDQAPLAAPADQVAPALVGILQKTDGQQSVTVRLQPAELGQVQIRIDQTVAGVAHIAITADRPETLQLLQHDEPRLQQVLDQAGVASTGRTVSFQVSGQEQIGATASRPDSMQTGAGASGQGQNGGAWRQNGDTPNDFGRSPDPDQGQNRPRWFRAGLDITA
jgi:flagellar hook-length control protein FliK